MEKSIRKKLKKENPFVKKIWENEEERKEYMDKEYINLLEKENKDDYDRTVLECIGREIGRML